MKCPKGMWYRALWTQQRTWFRNVSGVAIRPGADYDAHDSYVKSVRRGFWVKVLKFYNRQRTMVIAEVWTPTRDHQRGLALLFFPISPRDFVPAHPLEVLAWEAE